MTGETSVKSKASETDDDDDFYQSEDESVRSSANRSRASTAKKKKRRSKSAASTSSSTGKRRAGKKKALEKADNIMSDLIGMTEHSSESKGKKKSKVPKKHKKKSKSLGEHFGANSEEGSVLDDGVSCLTENSKSTKNSRSTKGTARSKSRNRKKRSSSKNSSRAQAINQNGDQRSPTNKSVTSRRSKSRSKKSTKNISLKSSHEDNQISKARPRRTQSLPLNNKASKGSSSLAAKKKANASSREGSVKLKILPDGTVKPSVPRRSTSVDKNHVWRENRVNENSDSDSDSVSLSDNSYEERIHFRGGRRAALDRSASLQQVKDTASVTKRKSHSPGTRSRNKPPPVRMATRGNSANIRSVSADNMREMQRHLARSHSNQSLQNSRNAGYPNSKKVHVAPSPCEAPLRRGVTRNSSAPLRSAMRSSSHSGRGPNQQRPPLRSTRSAYFQQPQRRPLARTNSRKLSSSEHVEMLRGFTENFGNDNRGRPIPAHDSEGMYAVALRRGSTSSRSHSPAREIRRNNSSRSDSSFRSKESFGRGSSYNHLSKSDVDPSDLEGSAAIKHDIEDYASENESLNDNVQVVDLGDMRDRSMSRDKRDRSMSRTRSQKLSRTSSEKSFLGISTHSIQSNRSQMSIDQQEPFENDPRWKAALRYIYILPPYKNEPKLKKKTRLFTWSAILLDFIAATVAVAQYQGSTTCCGDSVFDIIMDINWDALFRVVTYMYMVMILAEIIPVVKNGIPFNIVNPAIGLLITFGMFFDDSIVEAVAMWIIEAAAIFMEFMVYRVHARMFFETSFKLKQVDEELEELRKKRKEFIEKLHEGGMPLPMHGSRHGFGSRHSYSRDLEIGRGGSYDEEESLSGHSFGDEDFDDEVNSPPPRRISRTNSRDALGPSTHSNGANATFAGFAGGKIRLPGEIKQNKLLRRRRLLREHKKQESKDLHYHFIGSVLNIGLAVMAMIFIITIASTGGLCFKNNTINVFSFQQLERCDRIDISSTKDKYENCEIPDEPQCYLPYY